MNPHDREYAGAIAGMTETYGYRPQVADRVQVELPFTGEHGEGIVVELHGERVVVDVHGELLWYPHDKLRYVSR